MLYVCTYILDVIANIQKLLAKYRIQQCRSYTHTNTIYVI